MKNCTEYGVVMNVKKLADILNKLVADGSGDYEVVDVDYEDVDRVKVDDSCKFIRIF